MSVIGDFTVPAASFALADALASHPETRIEADRQATHSPREVFPFLWVTGGDLDAFESAFRDAPAVETVSVAERTDDAAMFRIVWDEPFQELIHDMIDHHASILEASASEDTWSLRLRFAEERMVSSFREHFEETGRRFEVRSLWHPSDPHQREYGLTAEQYDALATAVRAGYFDVPRGASATELGERLDISGNAASQRVRRGSATLVRNALLLDEEAEGT
ncbi:bacterio-opsin activator HTH domain-containing protein [Halosimplex carlsbadense 2-9-1]|uniref:Bacterio-opsin activator HTH domain-containing protein n=1 Tax=Halosimplex carlsbadense 2-9-1 TaxID=797114 RepID=M0CMP1_9EURY|nr:bacterio-opsin activator domain-containing protein [Halosimplex carlsbadense]ELZ23672.1 bacterio-opsin activator HTH domain-containing protein [Halosimplex carlsbadense 2-9-1]